MKNTCLPGTVNARITSALSSFDDGKAFTLSDGVAVVPLDCLGP